MTIRDLIDQLREIGYKHGWDVEVWKYDDDENFPVHESQVVAARSIVTNELVNPPKSDVVCVID